MCVYHTNGRKRSILPRVEDITFIVKGRRKIRITYRYIFYNE